MFCSSESSLDRVSFSSKIEIRKLKRKRVPTNSYASAIKDWTDDEITLFFTKKSKGQAVLSDSGHDNQSQATPSSKGRVISHGRVFSTK